MRSRPVKKLKWQKGNPCTSPHYQYADLPSGGDTYCLMPMTSESLLLEARIVDEECYTVLGEATDSRAAKLLCQKHFEKRILSCLTPAARRKLGA